MIAHYLKIAWRNLLKYRTQSIISIIGLAVGLFSFTVCFYCSRFIESRDHCFINHERIAELHLYDPIIGHYFSGTPAPLSHNLRSWTDQFEAVSFVSYPRECPFDIEVKPGKSLPYELRRMETDSLYARLFTPRILAGSWETASHTSNALVMTREAAVRIFGNINEAIGKTCTMTRRLPTSPESTPRDGGIAYTIQAVMEDTPMNNSLHFMESVDMLVLNDSEGVIQSSKNRKMTGGNTYALLRPEVDLWKLETVLVERHSTWTLYGTTYKVKAFLLGQFPSFSRGLSVISGITAAMGLLILLVGLLNFFHFLVGSYFNRVREFSLMKVNGCKDWQLFCLLLTQSLLVTLAASLLMLCGIELSEGRMDYSLQFFSMTFDKALLLEQAVQYIFLLIVLCVVICWVSTIRIQRMTIQTGLRGEQHYQQRHRGRNLMLGVQFFICWVFVTLTTGLYLQAEKTSSTLLSTLSRQEKASILSIPLDCQFLAQADKQQLIDRFRNHAAIKDVLLTDIGYLQGISGNSMMTEKDNPDSWIEVGIMAVPKNFFTFMNIPLEQGHGLNTATDMVVDRTWQQRMKKDVMGMSLYNLQHGYTVCGICPPFQNDTYTQSVGFVFISSENSGYIGHCYLKCESEQVDAVRTWVEQVLRESLPESVSVRVNTLTDDIRENQPLENKLKDIVLFFAIVSIILTLLGVYSSITLDTERRQKEVAIRKVNGAGVSQIILLFARLYIILLTGSAVLAFPLLYLVLIQWKRMYTVFFDYGFFFWVGIFMSVAAVTTLTVIFRILRIARQNPAEVIKRE